MKIHSRFMAVKKTVCIDQDDRKYRKNIKVQEICLFLQIEVSTNQDGIYILIFIYGIAIFLKYKLKRIVHSGIFRNEHNGTANSVLNAEEYIQVN